MSGYARLVAPINDLLVAPGASRAELALGYGAAIAGALGALACGWVADASPLQLVVLTVLGFDIVGGIAVNATPAAGRRFAEGVGWRRRAVTFVAAHVHPFVLAAVFPGQSWWSAALVYAGILLSAVLITRTTTLRRPVAYICAAALIVLAEVSGTSEPTIRWVAPLLVIKLILAHLLAGSVRGQQARARPGA